MSQKKSQMSAGVEFVSIDTITPSDYNPQMISDADMKKLEKSIEREGILENLVVNKDGTIISGHKRYACAKKLGVESVPVRWVDCPKSKEKALNVAMNKIRGEFDMAILPDLILSLDHEMQEITGFSEEEIGKMLDVVKIDSVVEDEVPETKKDPQTVLGDLWILGEHRLLCGDATKIDDVENLMNGEKADMVFTDPPYNQETEGGFSGDVGKALKKQSKEIESMCNFVPDDFLNILPSVFKRNTMNAIVFCNKDLVIEYLNWADNLDYSYNILFWKKPSAIPIGGSYRPDVEYMISLRKNAIFNSSIDGCSYSKCQEFIREKNKVHPTMKPVEMLVNQIKICSNRGGIVADFFGGSGSTLIACEQVGRKCYMMELDPKYVRVIIDRWEKLTGEKAILESTKITTI